MMIKFSILMCLIGVGLCQGKSKLQRDFLASRNRFSTSKAQPSDFICPEDFGYYPHPTDCTKYYVCVFGGSLLESCNGGLVYSNELQTCDWPRNVICNPSAPLGVSPPKIKESRAKSRGRGPNAIHSGAETVAAPSNIISRGIENTIARSSRLKSARGTKLQFEEADKIRQGRFITERDSASNIINSRFQGSQAVPSRSFNSFPTSPAPKPARISFPSRSEPSSSNLLRSKQRAQAPVVDTNFYTDLLNNLTNDDYYYYYDDILYDDYYDEPAIQKTTTTRRPVRLNSNRNETANVNDLRNSPNRQTFSSPENIKGSRDKADFKEPIENEGATDISSNQFKWTLLRKTKLNRQKINPEKTFVSNDFNFPNRKNNIESAQVRKNTVPSSKNVRQTTNLKQLSTADAAENIIHRPQDFTRISEIPESHKRKMTRIRILSEKNNHRFSSTNQLKDSKITTNDKTSQPSLTVRIKPLQKKKDNSKSLKLTNIRQKKGKPINVMNDVRDILLSNDMSNIIENSNDIEGNLIRSYNKISRDKIPSPVKIKSHSTRRLVRQSNEDLSQPKQRPRSRIISLPMPERIRIKNQSIKSINRSKTSQSPAFSSKSLRRNIETKQASLHQGSLKLEQSSIVSPFVVANPPILDKTPFTLRKTTSRFGTNRHDFKQNKSILGATLILGRSISSSSANAQERLNFECDNGQNKCSISRTKLTKKPQYTSLELLAREDEKTDNFVQERTKTDNRTFKPASFIPPSRIRESQSISNHESKSKKTKSHVNLRRPTKVLPHKSSLNKQSFKLKTMKPTTSKKTEQKHRKDKDGSRNQATRNNKPATAAKPFGRTPQRLVRPSKKPPPRSSGSSLITDIWRYPPSRPNPLYPQPPTDVPAQRCDRNACRLPDCSCGGPAIPGNITPRNTPQIVLLTFDDSVNDLNRKLYVELFERGRVNPNGCPISATFYISHEWTDYSQVQNLYSNGHEIASHSITHSFGEKFSTEKWAKEIAGQREIMAAYGGVRMDDIRGMRAPFLAIGGNNMFRMLHSLNFTYDSSMPVYENNPPSWPYTLDYKIFHECMIPPCPTNSYPGLWQVPMVMWQDLNGGRCSMGDACTTPPDAEGVYKMLIKNFERHYTTNRAPMGLFYHAAWFTTPHHKEGFIAFLDTIAAMDDVWLTTNWQALQWVRNPVPLSQVKSFAPFGCDYPERPARCSSPKVCSVRHRGSVRYLKTCQACPETYPWVGNTGVQSPLNNLG